MFDQVFYTTLAENIALRLLLLFEDCHLHKKNYRISVKRSKKWRENLLVNILSLYIFSFEEECNLFQATNSKQCGKKTAMYQFDELLQDPKSQVQ